jgi:TonB family protein
MQGRALCTVIALVWSLLTAVAAGESHIDTALGERYQNKILFFRHFYLSDSQEYDSEGRAIKDLAEGSWALYGQMQVEKIVLSKDKLQLEGDRVLPRFDGLAGRLVFVRAPEKVKVTFRLGSPLATVEEAAAVLGKVFTVTEEERISLVPDQWRPYLTGDSTAQDDKDDAKPAAVESPGTGKLFHLGDSGVTPPQIISRPLPEFSEEARKKSYAGVVGLNIVVDEMGRVRDVKVVHSVDKELDERAIESIKHWRFKPAKKDGVPVPVAVYIEVDFHLH